jgi:ubiquinone/menaquinone biosynthesis C-methylase UbiE
MLTISFAPDKFVDKILHSLRSNKARKYVKQGMTVCDLGCGLEGSFLHEIKNEIGKGYGFDLFVDNKFSDDKIRLEVMDLNSKIPLPDNSVDLVTTMATLEHLNDC